MHSRFETVHSHVLAAFGVVSDWITESHREPIEMLAFVGCELLNLLHRESLLKASIVPGTGPGAFEPVALRWAGGLVFEECIVCQCRVSSVMAKTSEKCEVILFNHCRLYRPLPSVDLAIVIARATKA